MNRAPMVRELGLLIGGLLDIALAFAPLAFIVGVGTFGASLLAGVQVESGARYGMTALVAVLFIGLVVGAIGYAADALRARAGS